MIHCAESDNGTAIEIIRRDQASTDTPSTHPYAIVRVGMGGTRVVLFTASRKQMLALAAAVHIELGLR